MMRSPRLMRRENLKDLVKGFVGKTLRVYTTSGVASCLGVLEKVEDDSVMPRSLFEQDRIYLAIQSIESSGEEMKRP
jgi:hypothetical protein